MNEKFTDILKGRNDGSEILNALNIKEHTTPTKKVLESVQKTIDLIDSGTPLAQAAAQTLGKASTTSTAITQKDSSKLTDSRSKSSGQKATNITQGVSTQNIPKDFIDEMGGEIRKTGQEYADELPGSIAGFTQEAIDNTDTGLRGVVHENFYAGMLNEVKKPEFKDRVRAEIKKRRAQSSKAK